MSFFVSLTVHLVSVTGIAPPHRTATYLATAGLRIGEDVSIGYLSHNEKTVRLSSVRLKLE